MLASLPTSQVIVNLSPGTGYPVFLNLAATPLIEMWMPLRTRSYAGSTRALPLRR